MNAKQLYLENGKPSGVFFCEKCKLVHVSLESAEKCCSPNRCTCCGKVLDGKYIGLCDWCTAKKYAQIEKAKFDKAQKIPADEYDGWVYLDGTGSEGYSDSVASFVERWEDDHDENEPLPQFVWACRKQNFAKLDLDHVLYNIVEEAWEDFSIGKDLNGVDELSKALDAFNAANETVFSYYPDESVAVLLNCNKDQR